MGRRSLSKDELNPVKFEILVRFMIVAAERKRFVEYNEINKVFGISIEDIRDYADALGTFCNVNGWSPLNSLIVNTTTGQPGADFLGWCQRIYNVTASEALLRWGECVSGCFVESKISVPNSERYKNTSGISASITSFLES